MTYHQVVIGNVLVKIDALIHNDKPPKSEQIDDWTKQEQKIFAEYGKLIAFR